MPGEDNIQSQIEKFKKIREENADKGEGPSSGPSPKEPPEDPQTEEPETSTQKPETEPQETQFATVWVEGEQYKVPQPVKVKLQELRTTVRRLSNRVSKMSAQGQVGNR